MISYWRIFSLELLTAVRTKTWAMLALASSAWILSLPHFLKADGTEEGFTELYVRYGFGGVFVLMSIAALWGASGSLAGEREAKRLQLTLVRPVRYTVLVLSKTAAHATVSAAVMLLSALLMMFTLDPMAKCSRVNRPVMESAAAEAEKMYDAYMASPETPEAVKKSKKSTVLRILTDRAIDRYDTVKTNSVRKWKFDLPAGYDLPKLRLRFAAHCGMRQDVKGEVTLDGWKAAVTNLTKSTVIVPLARCEGASPSAETILSFRNRGQAAVMLRPRKDIEVLLPSDALWLNLLRTWLRLASILTALSALGVFLSAGLSRSVALFTAMALLLVGELGTTVTENCSEDLESKFTDRVGLEISRAASSLMKPISSASPIEPFARGEEVDFAGTLKLALVDMVALPLMFALLSALTLPRKNTPLSR